MMVERQLGCLDEAFAFVGEYGLGGRHVDPSRVSQTTNSFTGIVWPRGCRTVTGAYRSITEHWPASPALQRGMNGPFALPKRGLLGTIEHMSEQQQPMPRTTLATATATAGRKTFKYKYKLQPTPQQAAA